MQVLTIMRVKDGTATEDLLPWFEPEAAKAWEYCAADMIRTIHFIANASGVVFLWEAPDVEIVRDAVDQLPMMQGGFLDLEVIPLKNYTGFDQLFANNENREGQ